MSNPKLGLNLVWDSLVAESQVATELIISGLRHLCGIPLPSDIIIGTVDDAKYPLHVGLHSFTAGFERLAKLIILLAGRMESGEFAPVRSYSHRLDKLLDECRAIGQRLDTHAEDEVAFVDIEAGTFGAAALAFLTEFASGPGRYSYLDSLSNGSRLSDPYVTWQELCGLSPSLSASATRSLWIYRELESLTYGPGRDDLEVALSGMFEARVNAVAASTSTALTIYEFIPPLATLLSRMANHAFYQMRLPGVPLLGEVVIRIEANPDDFLAWELLHLGDVDAVVEVIGERADDDLTDDDLTDDDLTDDD